MPKQKAIQAVDEYIDNFFEFIRTSNETYHGMHLRDLQILYFILSEHETQRVTVSELAQHLNITAAAASQVVTGYEKKKWIQRVRSKEDRRIVYIQVVDSVLENLKADWIQFDKNLQVSLKDVSAKELEYFSKVMDTIIEYFDENHPFFG